MPVSSGMGPSGSAGEGHMIGFGVVPVLTTLADAAGLGGCCACKVRQGQVATLRIHRDHWRDFMTLDCTAAGGFRGKTAVDSR